MYRRILHVNTSDRNITGVAITKRASGRRNHEAEMLVWGTMVQAPLRHLDKVWNEPDILKHILKHFTTMTKEHEKGLKERYSK